jgi:putative peptidoglycan lipid II flippase
VQVLQQAWLLFMLPHSVVAVSIATAYFTRMSGHAAHGDLPAVRQDLSSTLRIIGIFTVFGTVGLSVLAYPLSRIFLENDYSAVAGMGNVLIAFMPGLVLYSALFVVQRVFYAMDDTRTSFVVQCVQVGLFVIGALACLALPSAWIGVGIALVTTISGSVQTVVAVLLVRRRIGGVDGRRVVGRHLQYLGLALVSGLFGLLVVFALGGFSASGYAQSGKLGAIVTVVGAGAAMAVVYVGLLAAFRNPELAAASDTVLARFRRRH